MSWKPVLLTIAVIGGLSAGPVAVYQQQAAAARSADVRALEARLQHLEGIVPHQSTVMTSVAYHAANLWAAGERENWALAKYYLAEVQSSLEWAVRVRPVRPGPGGDVDLKGILDSIENTQLADLGKAIGGGRKAAFESAYDDTLASCTSCHDAVGKPWLRTHRPARAEVQVIDIDPGAPPVE